MNKLEKIIIIIPVLVALSLIGFFIKHHIDYSKEFSSAEWKSLYSDFTAHLENKELDSSDAYWTLSERKKMIKSLIKSEQLIGKNKEEVIYLLGLEDNDVNSQRWSYWLYFTAADNGWLVLNFNEADLVEQVSRYED